MRAFVDKEVIPYCHQWDENKQIPKELFTKAANAGILQGGLVVMRLKKRSESCQEFVVRPGVLMRSVGPLEV